MPELDERECDVIVVGAGPAGACAAMRLAKRGLHVCIIEKKTLPRYKTCGGGLLRRAVALLDVDISPAIERQCRFVDLNISGRMEFRAQRAEPIVSMVMRDCFDQLLVAHAVRQGATMIAPCRVTALARQGDRVRIDTSSGPVIARYVIAADGASSTVARLAGWGDPRRATPALECEVQVSAETFARFRDAAQFDFGPVPFGYAWVFPKREHLSIGVLTLRPERVNLNECFEKCLRALSIEPAAIQRHGFVIPLAPRDSTLAKGRVLLTGDAAGLADPVTAEGITSAIQSGQMAADAIAPISMIRFRWNGRTTTRSANRSSPSIASRGDWRGVYTTSRGCEPRLSRGVASASFMR